MNKNKVDVSQIFLVYMALIGDAERTALALDIEQAEVEKLAEAEGWRAKIARVSLMSKSGTPGDHERAQNRALNFVQAHQLRRSIDRAVVHLASLEPHEVLCHTNREGQTIYNARLYADLAASMEKIHALTYDALGDSPKERKDRDKATGEEVTAGTMHAGLIAALNNSHGPAPSEQLVMAAEDKVASLKSANPPV